jgi:WhiB family transcriptional regulator, redox-sensing transcriptional regulator
VNGRPRSARLPAAIGAGPAWLESASCRAVEPDVMFPDDDNVAGIEAAKAVCRGCPVRLLCLARALALGEVRHGVWGGLSGRERQARDKSDSRVQVA